MYAYLIQEQRHFKTEKPDQIGHDSVAHRHVGANLFAKAWVLMIKMRWMYWHFADRSAPMGCASASDL